jgi:hypothetical protein
MSSWCLIDCLFGLGTDVMTVNMFLISQVEFAIGDDWMCPNLAAAAADT